MLCRIFGQESKLGLPKNYYGQPALALASMGPSPTTPPILTITGMAYNHTQHGRWHYILLVFALATVAGAWITRSHPPLTIILLVSAAIFALCGLVFGSLTIRDEGDYVALRFGPLPLLHKTIRYADITAVELGHTSILDGWGIHYFPGRGWTYNVWGFACVKLTLGWKIIRVGTDDADELAKVIREKTELSRDFE